MRTKQYTLRNIPAAVDRVLRLRARQSGKSFNQVAVEALTQGAGEAERYDDLDFMIESLTPEQAGELEQEIQRQRHVDAELWR